MWFYFFIGLMLIILGIDVGFLITGAGFDKALSGLPLLMSQLVSFMVTTTSSILIGCCSGYLIYRYQTFRSIKTELIQSIYDVDLFFTVKDNSETDQLETYSQKKLYNFYELAGFREELLKAEGFATAASKMTLVNLEASEYVAYKDYRGIRQWKHNTLKRISNLDFTMKELLGFARF